MTALSPAASAITRLPLGHDAPEVRLLDARLAGLPVDVLRTWARSQRTPDSETFVTRSYCYPYALVAWHTLPVGIDIERVEWRSTSFADSISTPSERARSHPASSYVGTFERRASDEGSPRDRDRYATSLWSSKEALAKALGDPLHYDPRRLESPIAWPEGRCGPWRASELPAPAGHVAWICWQAHNEPGEPENHI